MALNKTEMAVDGTAIARPSFSICHISVIITAILSYYTPDYF